MIGPDACASRTRGLCAPPARQTVCAPRQKFHFCYAAVSLRAQLNLRWPRRFALGTRPAGRRRRRRLSPPHLCFRRFIRACRYFSRGISRSNSSIVSLLMIRRISRLIFTAGFPFEGTVKIASAVVPKNRNPLSGSFAMRSTRLKALSPTNFVTDGYRHGFTVPPWIKRGVTLILFP